MSFFDVLNDWVTHHKSDIHDSDFEVIKQANWGDSFDRGYWLDLESDNVTGRITLWGKGVCDMEIMRISDGKQLYWEDFSIINNSSIDDWFEQLAEQARLFRE